MSRRLLPSTLLLGALLLGAPVPGTPFERAVEAATLADELGKVAAPTVDTARSRALEGFAFTRGDVSYHFDKGAVYPIVDSEGRELGVVFLGEGRLDYTPKGDFLQYRLYRWTWLKTELHKEFGAAVLLYTGTSPLPAGQWGGAGSGASEAQDVLAKRWERLVAWPFLQDNRDVFRHNRGPNVELDLVEDKLDPVTGAGMRYLEVDARPGRRAVSKSAPAWAAPQSWWLSWYESPRGVQPVERLAPRGVFFTHGDSRAGYRAQIFYAVEPEGMGALTAADVKTADLSVGLAWDERLERLTLEEDVNLEVAADGRVARLLLVPKEPLTHGTGRNFQEAYVRVEGVKTAGGQALDFTQRGGEVLIVLPDGWDGKLAIRIKGDVAMGAGVRAESGIFPVWSPVGSAFDRVVHTLKTSGLAATPDVTVVAGRDETPPEGGARGSFESPHIDVGRFVFAETNLGGIGRVEAHTLANQAQGGQTGKELAASLLGQLGRIVKVMGGWMGPLPAGEVKLVQADDRVAPGIMGAGNISMASLDDQLRVTGLQAQLVARQWWGIGVPPANEVADFWLFQGLRTFLANWSVETVHVGHPYLEQHLDQWMRGAKRSQQKGRRLLLAFDSGAVAFQQGAQAKGYLLYNNLRYSVGDAEMARALKATYQTLAGGEPASADALIQALGAATARDLRPLFAEGIAFAPYDGALDVVWHVEKVGTGSRVTARATPSEDAGPTLGAALRVTFRDMRQGVIFAPAGQAVELSFETEVRKVEVLKRGCGLVQKVSVTKGTTPVK